MKPAICGLPFESGHDFPDSRIGASLKPAEELCQDAAPADFPDSRIGASLKHAVGKDALGIEDGTSPIRESGPH